MSQDRVLRLCISKTRSIRVTYRSLRKVAERAQEGDDDGGHI